MISCLLWLLVTPAIAGEAAARDVQEGMHPLLYSAPIRKGEYLGGRFLAALLLNALVLLGVQVGSVLAAYAPGVDPAIIGPFRPAAYLAAYLFIALPNAFVATTFQFGLAMVSGRSLASYAGSLALFFFTFPVPLILYFAVGAPRLALLMDPIGMMAIMNEMMTHWTIAEKNVRPFTLEGAMLWNRLLWLGIATATLAAGYLRFRFAHRAPAAPWNRLARWVACRVPRRAGAAPVRGAIPVPQAHPSFGPATHLRQMLAIARSSFQMIVTSVPGLFLLVGFPMFAVLVLVVESEHWGVPLLPRTGYILEKHITAPLTQFADFRVIVPLLILYFAGDLLWQERDAGLSETMDAMAVPEWALFLGKLLGLGLLLGLLMVSLTGAGLAAQLLRGYHDFQPMLYLTILFGLQLPEYLLFALLVLTVQAVVNHKHVGMLLSLLVYLCIIFAPFLGVEHNLLVYGSSPAWAYTDMRGFGGSIGPWLWFKLYWAAWALLLAVVARLLWVRGRESAVGARLRLARQRLTRATVGTATVAVGLILALGTFIFYNTNVLNEHLADDESVRRSAAYEQRYGQYEGIPQPQRSATSLQVEIYPDRGAATIRGSYRLVNRDEAPIARVHVEPASFVETAVSFDRAAQVVVADEVLGHFIYALEEPLQPGDGLTLTFDVRFEPRGFAHSGAEMAIVGNGSFFTGAALPVIGYQPRRELLGADERRQHGLPRQVTLPPPTDIDPRLAALSPATFEAIVGTDADQVAVAPGALRRTWEEAGRRYFHYGSEVPIKGLELFLRRLCGASRAVGRG